MKHKPVQVEGESKYMFKITIIVQNCTYWQVDGLKMIPAPVTWRANNHGSAPDDYQALGTLDLLNVGTEAELEERCDALTQMILRSLGEEHRVSISASWLKPAGMFPGDRAYGWIPDDMCKGCGRAFSSKALQGSGNQDGYCDQCYPRYGKGDLGRRRSLVRESAKAVQHETV